MSIGDMASRGFTLIEMLVTIAIITLISTLAFPALERSIKRQEFATASARLELAVRQTRADAIRRDEVVSVTRPRSSDPVRRGPVDLDGLPSRMVVDGPLDGLRFYPDGSSNGGTISLVDGARSFRLAIARDTGAIRVQP